MERRVKLVAGEIAMIGMMVAMIEVSKQALSFIPNVELVSFLIIMFTLVLRRKILYVLSAFVLMEGCIYGFGLWWIMYLYAWPILALLTWCVRKSKSVWVYSTLSGLFGLCFGLLCSIPYLFIGGIHMAFTWWVAGIPFDLIHGVSNFMVCMLLFKPVYRAISRFRKEENAN